MQTNGVWRDGWEGVLRNRSILLRNPFGIALLLVVAIGGCIPQMEAPVEPASTPAASVPATPSTARTATPAARSAATPTTRTVTLNIEGEATPVKVSRYETPDFVTELPTDFVARPSASGEGRAVRFVFNPTGKPDAKAYVHLFFSQSYFTSQAPDAKTIAAGITGNRGLLASNRWERVNQDNSPPYAWAKTAIGYRDPTTADQSMGTIYMGEHRGKGFIVFTHFPAEYADGFLPRANVILENLNLR